MRDFEENGQRQGTELRPKVSEWRLQRERLFKRHVGQGVASGYRHQPYETNYFLFETVCVSLDNAVLKHLGREADRHEREFAAWEQWKSQCKTTDTLYLDWERHTVNRLLVEQILEDDVLTDDERTLLRTIYENPDESLRDIGTMLGHPNHMTAVRTLERIRRKLQGVYRDGMLK